MSLVDKFTQRIYFRDDFLKPSLNFPLDAAHNLAHTQIVLNFCHLLKFTVYYTKRTRPIWRHNLQ